MVAIDWKKQNNIGIAILMHTNAQSMYMVYNVYVYMYI